MYFPDLPTSLTSALPRVLDNLDAQVSNLDKSTTTRMQYVGAHLTASVAVAFFAAVDTAWHAALAVTKLPVAIVKATAAKWVGCDQKISTALSISEVFAHAKKAYNSALMVPSALWGFTRPALVLMIATEVGLRGSPVSLKCPAAL